MVNPLHIALGVILIFGALAASFRLTLGSWMAAFVVSGIIMILVFTASLGVWMLGH